MDLGSGIRKKPIPDSGSRIQGSKRHRIPDPGSATLVGIHSYQPNHSYYEHACLYFFGFKYRTKNPFPPHCLTGKLVGHALGRYRRLFCKEKRFFRSWTNLLQSFVITSSSVGGLTLKQNPGY
jgi:hypothetical protein